MEGLILFKSSLKPFLGCLPLIAALFIFDDFHLLLKIGIAAAVYGLALICLSVFDRKETEILKKILLPTNDKKKPKIMEINA